MDEVDRRIQYQGKTPALHNLLGFWFPWEETLSEHLASQELRPFLDDGGHLPDGDVRRSTLEQDAHRASKVGQLAAVLPDSPALLRLDLADLVALREQVIHHVEDLQAPPLQSESFQRGFWVHSLLVRRILDGRDAKAAIEVALCSDDDAAMLELLHLDPSDRVDSGFVEGFAAGNQAVARFVRERLEAPSH